MTPQLTMAASGLLAAIQQPGVRIKATKDLEASIATAIHRLDKALNDVNTYPACATEEVSLEHPS